MSKPKIGLLGLTLELYEGTAPELRKGREAFVREKLAPALADVADVRFDGAVFAREAVERAVAGFEADGVDAILVVLLSYAQSLVSAPALKRTDLPIVVWNTQELLAVNESYGNAEMLANHGVHGTHDLCNVLVRAGVPFEYVTGHVDDAEAVGELGDFFRAAYAAGRLRQARLGLLGYPFPGMGDFGLDTTHMATSLGCAWTALSVAEYVKRCAEADAAQVKKLVGEYQKAYDIASGITTDELAEAARAEVALRGMVEDNRLDAVTYEFLAFGEDERVETLPFVGMSRLLGEGIGFGGEGDLISSAGTVLLNWLNPPASFSEIFTVDFAGGALFVSHMGEANVGMNRRDRKPRVVKREASLVPIRGSQLAPVVSFEPGEATLVALTLTAGQHWRLIAAPMTIEDFGPLEVLAVPHSKIKPKGDVREFLTGYAKAGGPHHLAVCFGDARRRLRMLAGILGADFCEL